MAFSTNPLVAGNWKMHGLQASLGEISAIADGIARGEAGHAACVLCPPVSLLGAAAGLGRPALKLGAQDCATQESGAHTGDLSAEMLRDAGASFVIVGHSERRAGHGETDTLVRAKAEAAHRAGLVAIVCLGETREERDAGEAFAVVGGQIDGSLPLDATADNTVLAYEPVWSIGTGHVPSRDDVVEMHRFIRQRLVAAIPDGARVRILYGGSVKPDNAATLLEIDNVDGALIGGASLNAKDFLAIASVYR